MKLLACIALTLIALPAFSQWFINNTKKQTRHKLERYLAKDKINGTFKETDTTITLLIRDTSVLPADFTFSFNNKGKCIAETRMACDSCVRKYVANTLKQKRYNWKKVDDNNYVSSKGLVLEVDADKEQSSYSIRKTRKGNRS